MTSPRPLNPTQLHILLTLADGVRHGYAIKREIEQRTEGALRLGPAVLYESIQRLQVLGLIDHSNMPLDQTDNRLNRRYYRITDHGLATLRGEVDRLGRVLAFARTRTRLKGEPT